MSDDFDALLDDALDDFKAQEQAAEIKAQHLGSARKSEAQILEEALLATGGERTDGGNVDEAEAKAAADLADVQAMFSQLRALVQQTEQLGDVDPDSPDSAGHEQKLIDMAQTFISHAHKNVDDAEDRARIESTMKALHRVQEITSQGKHRSGNDAEVTAELKKISDDLHEQVEQSRSKVPAFLPSFGSPNNVVPAATTAATGDSSSSSSAVGAPPPLPQMSDQERQQFEAVVRQMQQSAAMVHGKFDGSQGQAQQEENLSPEQQAVLFAMLSSIQQQQQQQLPPKQSQSAGEHARSSESNSDVNANPLLAYYNLIFAKFESIDSQYDVFFEERGQLELKSGNMTQVDWERFKQQHATIKELLKFKEKQVEMMQVSSNDNDDNANDGGMSVDQLNAIVARLKQLGDPPSGFNV